MHKASKQRTLPLSHIPKPISNQSIFKVMTLSHIWHFDFNGKTHQVLSIKYVQHSVYQSNLCVLFLI